MQEEERTRNASAAGLSFNRVKMTARARDDVEGRRRSGAGRRRRDDAEGHTRGETPFSVFMDPQPCSAAPGYNSHLPGEELGSDISG